MPFYTEEADLIDRLELLILNHPERYQLRSVVHQLMELAAKTAAYRKEIVSDVADIQVRRAQQRKYQHHPDGWRYEDKPTQPPGCIRGS